MSDASSFRVDLSSVKPISMSGIKAIHISEADKDLYDSFIEMTQNMLKAQYTEKPDLSGNEGYRLYATVKVNGEVVAKFYNNGSMESSNSLGSQLANILPGDVNGESGPVLAQARAEMVADMLGGIILNSPTAITQAKFRTIPPIKFNVDYNAMYKDPMYQSLKNVKEARTLFLAQQLAQSKDV